MLQFAGQWYDGAGSNKTEVRLELSQDGRLSIFNQQNGALIHCSDQQLISISSRLANSPRYLNFPDGQSVETLNNDCIDQWIKQCRPSFFVSLVYRLESNFKFVALTLLLVLTVVWGTAQYGIPAASQAITKALPAELLDRASDDTLVFLEQYWLKPSQLSAERQQQLRKHFSEAITSHEDLRIQVDFRSSEEIGANAFALPNGRIIFTDSIVALAVHDDELLAILGHEIAHVKYRHSMRRLVQNSLFIFLLAMITGDVSGTSEVVLGLPVLFAELAYSRSYEAEADNYALGFLRTRNIPTHRFADLMIRLEGSHYKSAKTEARTDDASHWRQYLSTHPMTADRIKAFK
ncbi:M48 family metallopeptidase [Neptunomonas sp.]|uniref:M48 family metallopeptidase n=1 Tax=Neptunomonas sp. TaxID=1971898 RepID=UPI0025F53689|nr:M48 family metallopeptidase [Neptunomonas sp.]